MPAKNNVTRMLDARGIPYQAFELPERKVGALEAAEVLGVSPRVVYKTIVAVPPDGGKPILALVAGPEEIEPKALARAVGEKKVKVTSQREAERLTGLQAGGISPLALLHKGFRVVVDRSAEELDHILVSGGQWGLNISIAVADLVQLTGAKVHKISK
jgi:Cys-tRNA(Pro)/Cys-tRNA(Cys) deacylase